MDEETRQLWRKAGTGDFDAAVDYVIALMRGSAPTLPAGVRRREVEIFEVDPHFVERAHYVQEKPPTADELRARTRIGAYEIWRGLGREPYESRDTLARWLLIHQGKIINLLVDPQAFEAVEPQQEVQRLREQVGKLAEICRIQRDTGRVLKDDPRPSEVSCADCGRLTTRITRAGRCPPCASIASGHGL